MKYFVRAAKYFVALCVLCLALMALMIVTGTSALSLDDTLYAALHTTRFAKMFGAILLLAAFYPRFGFIVREVEGDMEEHREQILNAMRSAGFSLLREEEGKMIFRADTLLRKAMLLFEDEIEVTQYGQWIRLDGIRRGVAHAAYRLDAYLTMVKRNE